MKTDLSSNVTIVYWTIINPRLVTPDDMIPVIQTK